MSKYKLQNEKCTGAKCSQCVFYWSCNKYLKGKSVWMELENTKPMERL